MFGKPKIPERSSGIGGFSKPETYRQGQENKRYWEEQDKTPPEVKVAKIFREIERGNFENLSMLETVSPDIIQKIIERHTKGVGGKGEDKPIFLSSLKEVSLELVRLLIEKGHKAGINFTNVKNISIKDAELLSHYQGPIDLFHLTLREDRQEAEDILIHLARCPGRLRIRDLKILERIQDIKKRDAIVCFF